MKIVKAEIADLDKIVEIYSGARAFMRACGNTRQWNNGYPPKELSVADIESGKLNAVKDEDGEILAVFYFEYGIDPTYVKIYEGEWKTPEPYGVIHRIAVSEKARGRGVSGFCFEEMLKKCPALRIDTHRDNIPMQKVLKKFGFSYAGIIYLANGDERLAYEIERN